MRRRADIRNMKCLRFLPAFRITLISPQASLFLKTATTLALGALGGGIFHVLGLPAAWLSGAMVLVAVAVLSGIPCAMPNGLRDALFVVLGLTMGSGVKPETIARIGEWPVTMALLVVSVVAILGATYLFQRRVAGWDKPTAYFAAIPGALSYVMILTLSYPRADAMRVVMAQSFRVFVLVAVLPAIIVGSDTHGLGLPPQVDPLPPHMLALLAAAGLAAGYAFNRAGVPAGWLTGPFFLSAIVNAAGWVQVELPQWLSLPALVGLGCVIGCRFTNLSPREFARMLGVSLGAFIVGMSIATAISGLIWALFGLPFGQLLLAFAPGGLEAMTLLAFLLNLDPAFVAAHQLVRYVGMVLLLPLITRRLLGPPEKPS